MFRKNCFKIGLEKRILADFLLCICYCEGVCYCCMLISERKECKLNKTLSW